MIGEIIAHIKAMALGRTMEGQRTTHLTFGVPDKRSSMRVLLIEDDRMVARQSSRRSGTRPTRSIG
jgi:hypothetical protein